MAGRCTEDPIFINDLLSIEGSDAISLRVLSIDVYGKQESCLHRGYVGNLFLQRNDSFQSLLKLIDGSSKSAIENTAEQGAAANP